jgi:site-specific DNA-methyltransferase (adenine-specific)
MSEKARYEVICSDAFSWLRTRRPRTIHAVVTDPPYGVVEYLPDQLAKRQNGKGGIWRLPPAYDGHSRSPMPRFTVLRSADHERVRQFHARLAPLLFRIIVPGGHVIIASQNLLSHLVIPEFTHAGFEIRGQIARVVKTLRGGDRPKDAHAEYPGVSVTPRSSWEPWLVFRRPCEGRVKDNLEQWGTGALRRPAEEAPFRDLIESSPVRGEERRIASQKPQAFMRQIVWASLPLGRGVILDPFMGSGSTVAAAEHLGLRSIGIEVDPAFFRLAEQAIPQLATLAVNGVTKRR